MKNISKQHLLSAMVLFGAMLLPSCAKTVAPTAAPTVLISQVDSLSYSYGVMLAHEISSEAKLDPEVVATGLIEAMKDTAIVTLDKAKAIILQGKIQVGVDFLATNGKKEGVITTESGLQYKVIKEGDGQTPSESDVVSVHYKGTLINGHEFDNSIERGEPITFPLNRVIKGWTEGIQLMKEGGKAILYIPHDLAYGERGAGDVIAPYSVLIFEVELLKAGR